MSSNYGYNPSDARTFNQLVQQGLSAEDAATQTEVSNNPGAYGYGTNSNLGSIIPGAGGVVGGATDAPELTSVPYSQSSTGQPTQQPPQTNAPAAGISTFQDPAQRAGQNALTSPQPSASPFAAFDRVETVPIVAPAPSTFQDPSQRAAAAAAIVPPAQQAAEPAPAASPITESQPDSRIISSTPAPAASPITESQPDSRIISSTPAASSGFGYGTGINNPSVAPTTAADPINANTSGIPIRNEEGAVVEGIRTNPETGETYYTTVTDQQRVDSAQAAAIDANTSGIPIRNEEGAVVEGIRTNPETGETYYTDPPVAPAPDRLQQEPTDVEQNDAEIARLNATGASVGSINSVQDPQQRAEAAANAQAVVGTQLAQRQAVLEAQRKLVNNGDWRVRLSLAAGANYLYSSPDPGILAPLAQTGGVIFPYLPKIDTTYTANYETSSLTHSNHTNYFYKSSSVGAVGLTATFTAQDTTEANYLLAVIHFFRSVTKMFYGQDAQRGAPPPLVYLTGLGAYQFSAHPCLVQSFSYSLPNDVDYIRAGSTNVNGTNLLTRRVRQNLPTDPISGAVKRLSNLFTSQGINKGAINDPPAPPTLGKNTPTYVPTKLDITLSLYPVQTRSQVSQVFSLKSFANGDLIKGGFW
jgi:hypothetical protein